MSTFNCSDVFDLVSAQKSESFLFVFSWSTLAAAIIYFPATFLYFYTHRNEAEELRRRNIVLLLFYMLGMLFAAICLSLRNIVGGKNISCELQYFLYSLLIIDFCFLSNIFRIFGLHLRICFNRGLLSTVFDILQSGELVFRPGEETFTKRINSRQEESIPVLVRRSFSGKDLRNTQSYKLEDEEVAKSSKLKRVLFYLFCWKDNPKLPDSMQLLFFLASSRFINTTYAIVVLLELLLSFCVYFLIVPTDAHCKGCSIRDLVIFHLLQILLCGVLVFIALLRTRKYIDPLGIKTELFSLGIVFLSVNMLILLPAIIFFNSVDEQGKWDWSMIAVVEVFFFAWLSFVHQVGISRTQTRSSMLGTEVNIKEILSSKAGTKAFALYLALHLSVEHLYFYKAVEDWKNKFEIRLTHKNNARARDIFQTYINQDTLFQVNLSHETRDALITEFSVTENLPKEVFDRAQKETYFILSTSLFAKFLESKYYTLFQNKVDINFED